MKKYNLRILVVLIATAITVVTLTYCQRIISSELQLQLYNNLKDVAMQNKVTMEKELNSKYDLLMDIALQIESDYPSVSAEEDIYSLISFLSTYTDIYDFKRMGFIDTNGLAYTTDGYVRDLSASDVYLYGMQGRPYISQKITDTIGDNNDVTIFSITLYNTVNSEIMGMLFATYPTDTFKEMLNVDSFDGAGYSYIVTSNGTVVTDSAKSPLYGTTNIFETLLSFSVDNTDNIRSVREDMDHSKSGYVTFKTDTERYYYYSPLNLIPEDLNWYMFTIVPTSVLEARTNTIYRYQTAMIAVILPVTLILSIFFILSYRRSSKELQALAYVNPLTGGDTYAAFLKKLTTSSKTDGYLISLDFSNFKLLNSICGVEKGNEVLKSTWNIISSKLRVGEIAAHIKGDQFILFMIASTKELLLERIRELSDSIVSLAQIHNTVCLSPYFGIYKTDDFKDPEASHTYAIQAKNSIKGNQHKNWAFYEDVNFEALAETKKIEDSFDEAIRDHDFEVWYQPKYSSETSKICGAEALVRWRQKDGSLLPPYKFIPLLEQNGKIITLDEYVFKTVCKQLNIWKLENRELFPVSVNISRASLYYDSLVERYVKILQKYHTPTSLVPLEITESAAINTAQIQELVAKFRDAGFPIYLDDFGNGYSSLAALNLLHFDTLKLDKSLIDFVGDPRGEKLLSYTIMLAKSLNMTITAEGVETIDQVNFLNSMKCDELQGYYFSKPLPLADFEQLF
ncbi:MAG: EAL domain-containing protein [Lachnospiraceae bacterium]|nr:EAL domain-containing protein [Lachnospiraceae bacterium]